MALGPLSARQRAMRYLTGLLRYDEPQTLTAPQRTQARANIGAADAAAVVPPARSISAGMALTGGGDLTQNRTISADLATEAEAQDGAGNAKLMTPIRTRQAIDAVTIGRGGQGYVVGGRSPNTTYQNSTASPIFVTVSLASGDGALQTGPSAGTMQTIYSNPSWGRHPISFIVPPGHHYRLNSSSTIWFWSELR